MRTACIILALASLGAANINVGHLRKGLVMDMPLDAAHTSSSTIALDLSGQHTPNDGVVGTPTFTADGVVINAADEYLTTTVSNYRDGDTEGGICVWVNIDSLAAARTVWSSSDTATNDNYLLLSIDVNGAVNWQVRSPATNDILKGTSGSVTTGNWHFICATADASRFLLYVDGQNEAINVFGGTDSGRWFDDVSGVRDNAIIGSLVRLVGSSSSFTGGTLARLRIYTPEPSPATIAALFACGHRGCDRNAAVSGLPAVNAAVP